MRRVDYSTIETEYAYSDFTNGDKNGAKRTLEKMQKFANDKRNRRINIQIYIDTELKRMEGE